MAIDSFWSEYWADCYIKGVKYPLFFGVEVIEVVQSEIRKIVESLKQ